MKKIIFILLLIGFIKSFGQTNFSLDAESGLGFNPDLSVGGENVINLRTSILGFHFTTIRNKSKKVLLEASLFTLLIKSKGQLGNSAFTIKKSNLGIDLISGYNFFKNTQILGGFSISTIPELVEINFNKPDNLKLDFILKINQEISQRFSANMRTRYLLNNLGNQILMTDPKFSITLGVNYKLRKA